MEFFSPLIHLSQQLSFILISFYLNLQNCTRDEKEVELLNNHAPCGAGWRHRARGKVAWALLGFWQQEPSPRARQQTPWGWCPVGGQEHLLSSSLGKSHNTVSVLHQHCIPGAGELGILPLAAHHPCIWVPLTCFGAQCVLCSPFRVVSTLFPFQNLGINQLHLSGIVDRTLKTEGGWKPCGKSPRWVCGFISSSN